MKYAEFPDEESLNNFIKEKFKNLADKCQTKYDSVKKRWIFSLSLFDKSHICEYTAADVNGDLRLLLLTPISDLDEDGNEEP